jgi:TolA-binding protein
MNEPLENLMAKARRGNLRDEERRRLELGLNTSLEATLLYQAGCAFDQETVVMTGDETFLESLAAQAARRFGHCRRSAQRRTSTLAAAVWVISGLVAAATVGATYHFVGRLSSHAPKSVALPVGPVAQRAVQGTSASATVAPQCASAARQPEFKQASRTASPGTAVPPRQTAQSLFQLANEARVNGNIADAVRDYRLILSEFAYSREAELSTMSLGMLELQRGNAQAALPQFRRAHAANASPEALWGEAQALRQLGRAQEERLLLQELLARYPGSAYAPAASKRLEMLE